MSHTQIQWARGTTSEVSAYTGPQGELVIDTDDNSLHVQDGATASGFIVGGAARNAQTGASYAVVAGDQGKLITFDNAGAVAVTLPQAVAANNFQDGARIHVLNLGVGTVTLTPSASTINGAASLTLASGQGGVVVSDGANYWAIVAVGASALAAGTIPKASSAGTLQNSLLTDAGNLLAYNLNSVALSGAPANPTFNVGQADGLQAGINLFSFGASSQFTGIRADGTNASKTGLVAGDTMVSYAGRGWNGTSYVSGGFFSFVANESWSGTARGTLWELQTIANGTTSFQIEAAAQSGFVIGGATGGAKGLGTVNASGFYINGIVQGPWVAAPAHDNSTGTAGQVAYDGSYFYVCTAANTWARAAIGGTW